MLTINFMKKLIKILLLTVVLIPAVTSAQFGGVQSLITFGLKPVVDLLINLMMGSALLVFFWGLVKYILAQGSETVKMEAKKVMGWGLVALFVMVSVWGLVKFIQNELLPGADFNAPPIPNFTL